MVRNGHLWHCAGGGKCRAAPLASLRGLGGHGVSRLRLHGGRLEVGRRCGRRRRRGRGLLLEELRDGFRVPGHRSVAQVRLRPGSRGGHVDRASPQGGLQGAEHAEHRVLVVLIEAVRGAPHLRRGVGQGGEVAEVKSGRVDARDRLGEARCPARASHIRALVASPVHGTGDCLVALGLFALLLLGLRAEPAAIQTHKRIHAHPRRRHDAHHGTWWHARLLLQHVLLLVECSHLLHGGVRRCPADGAGRAATAALAPAPVATATHWRGVETQPVTVRHRKRSTVRARSHPIQSRRVVRGVHRRAGRSALPPAAALGAAIGVGHARGGHRTRVKGCHARGTRKGARGRSDLTIG
mmetsp:Transcript_23342/g.63293  ORF Transcript_23342/g.63293 Transcript_23342/m.63293 type:complete len:353 (+) Transcript_23342:196-1254(+)